MALRPLCLFLSDLKLGVVFADMSVAFRIAENEEISGSSICAACFPAPRAGFGYDCFHLSDLVVDDGRMPLLFYLPRLSDGLSKCRNVAFLECDDTASCECLYFITGGLTAPRIDKDVAFLMFDGYLVESAVRV